MSAVRIRGLYSTALTKIFLDENITIAQPSKQIMERFSLNEELKTIPANITIKNHDELVSTLVIIGSSSDFPKILEILKKHLKHSLFFTSELEQYSTITVTVQGEDERGCYGEYNRMTIYISTKNCINNKIVKASVYKAPVYSWEFPRAREGISVYKNSLVLFSWKTFSISRHIKDQERRNFLEEISLEALSKGYGIKWRSNAGVVPEKYLEKELDEALKEIQVIEQNQFDTGKKLSMGQKIGIVKLSLIDNFYMDSKRSKVVPTIEGHHHTKNLGKEYQLLVEYAEYILQSIKDKQEKQSFTNIVDFLWKKTVENKTITLVHKRPDGKEITIGPLKLIEYLNEEKISVYERKTRTKGLYDGLQVQKEPGDIINTYIPIDNWFIIHTYMSPEGKPKGVYVNINTPPEPAINNITYIDLHIDLVKTPEEKPRIIDREKLEAAINKGIITEHNYRKAIDLTEKLANQLKKLKDPHQHIDRQKILELIKSIPMDKKI